MNNKIHLASRIQLYIFISVILVASIFLTADLVTEHFEYKQNAENIRQNYYTQEQAHIKEEVIKVQEMIQDERLLVQNQIYDTTKNAVEQGYNVALHIYSKYKNIKPEYEIKEIIKDALKPVRFGGGAQYFFIISTDADEIMLDNHPDTKGLPLKNYADPHGNHVLKDMAEIAETDGEGFYSYLWSKPGTEGADHGKASYVKLFKPFGWVIGTGVYFEDYEKTMQTRLLKQIGKIRFGPDLSGYIFVVSFDGVTLMNGTQRHLIGENIWDMEDVNGVKVIQEEYTAAQKPGGDFIHYHWLNPKTGKISEKVSYIKGIQDWEWMIGAGFYYDDIEPELNRLHDEIYDDRKQEFYEYLIIVILISLLLLMIKRLFTRRIDKDMSKLTSFFKNAAHEDRLIDTEPIRYSEFAQLAEYANMMLKERIAVKNSLEELNTGLHQRVQAEIRKNEKHVQLLHEQKKLADMGQMINAIAHQWRQPLNNIHLITQMLEEIDEGENYQLDKSVLYKQHGELVEYMSKTIDDFRNYFSVKKQKHDFSLSEEIKKTIDLLSAQLRASDIIVELESTNEGADDIFHGFSGEFRQIVMNLLSNAKDAISDKRKNTGSRDEEFIRIFIESKKEEIVVSISNTGGIIPEEIISKIFNPYFTTKDEGKGTGIGLYLTKTMIEKEMNGTITAANNDSGAVFTITLKR